MERRSRTCSSVFFFVVFCFFLAPAAAGNSMFIFGDAYFDTGNNNYIGNTPAKANVFPYGISFFPSPTGRFSDGRLIPDFVAKYANLSFLAPYLQPGNGDQFQDGVNFASGGSGALAQTFQGGVIDLNMQLDNYKKFEELLRNKIGDYETMRRFSEAVYLFSVGTNDYAYLFLTNSTLLSTYTKSDFVDMVISNITNAVREVYKTGGRKFGFLNIAVLGCLPGLRILTTDGDCIQDALIYANLHNEALLRSLKLLEKQLPDFKYSVFDANSCVQLRIDHPSLYGYKETRGACCGSGRLRGEFSCGGKRGIQEYEVCDNRDEYVFWDAFHFTEKVHHQCADEIWNSPNNLMYYGPYTIKDLFYLA